MTARIHEVVFNAPLDLYKSHRNIDDLVLIRQETWYDYRHVPELTETYRDEVKRLRETHYDLLKSRALAYDAPSMFEYALRYAVRPLDL